MRKASQAKWMQSKVMELAHQHESDFVTAFEEMIQNIISGSLERKIARAWDRGDSVVDILNLFPFWSKDMTDDAWLSFAENLKNAYIRAVTTGGQSAAREMNMALGTRMHFLVHDVLKAKKIKIDEKLRLRFRTEIVAPINPYSMKWIDKQSLKLMRESIGGEQKDVVRAILSSNFRRGVRSTSVIGELRDSVGLTKREYDAVQHRKEFLESTGIRVERVDFMIDKYRSSLLTKRAQRIARTETFAAVNQGRVDSWKLAQDEGLIPKDIKRVWVAGPGASRPCEQCEELDGMLAGLDEEFEGGVSGPPAHPSCRCTTVLSGV